MSLLDTAVEPEPARTSAPAPARPAARRRRSRRQLLPYLLLVPAVVLELLIHVVPMLVGVAISFLELTQFYVRNWQRAPFAGGSNYALALDVDAPSGQALLRSFGVTLAFTALLLLFSWLIGMTAAVLTQRPFRGRALVRTLFLIPFALPIFTSVITWSFMAQRDTGVVNHVLVDQLGLLGDRPFWLIGSNSFVTLVAVTVWRTWPFAFLCITAGMQSIPDELYEAAALDGAGVWDRLKAVTLPLLAPVNRVLVLVMFLWTFNDFTTPYTLFGRSAPRESNLISMHIYQNSFVTWNFGTGSAMSVLLLLFLLVVTGGYLYAGRKADA